MAITDADMIGRETRDQAIRDLTSCAVATREAAGPRVGVVRSAAGEWRVVGDGSAIADGEHAVWFRVQQAEHAGSPSLLGRVAWATLEIWREVLRHRRG